MNATASHLTNPNHPFFRVTVLIGAIACSTYVFAGVMLYRYGALTNEYGWKYSGLTHVWRITEVDPRGVAAGKLQVGDTVLAVNGDHRIAKPIIGDVTWLERFEPIQLKLRWTPPQTPYHLQVSRDGQVFEYDLKTSLVSDGRNFLKYFSIFSVSMLTCLLGLFIGLARPEKNEARLACCCLTALAMTSTLDGLRPVNEFFKGPELLVYFAILTVHPLATVLGYHLVYRFPAGIPEGRIWTLIRNFLYFGYVVLMLTRKMIQWDVLHGDPAGIDWLLWQAPLLRSFAFVSPCFEVLVFVSVTLVLRRNFLLAAAADQRRRIRWFVYGVIAGITPWGCSRVLSLLKIVGLGGFISELTFSVQHFGLLLISAAVAYSVVKHRVFDVTVVIRRSLQYVLAKNVLQVVIWLPIISILYRVASNPRQTVADILFSNPFSFALLGVAAVALKFRQPLRTWIDRRFFREAYDQEQVLIGLIEDIKNREDLREIAKMVSQRIDAALYPQGIYIFFQDRQRHELIPRYMSSEVSDRQISFTEESSLFRIMESATSALEIGLSQDKLTAVETEWLSLLGINLMVPMKSTEGHLVGLLLLGEKKSQEPYSGRDQKLLQAIAGEMATVYEMTTLKERIGQKEKIERDVLAKLEDQNLNLVKECPRCGRCYDSTETNCLKDRTPLTLSLPVERTVAEKYRLERLLGKGGMGAVYEATDLRLGRKVAIKILLGSFFGDSAALRRFEREARTSSRLNHPNIVTVYDTGGLRQEGAYLVMELLTGETLRAALNRMYILMPDTAAGWFDQICDGLKAAHRAGVIHRDLKPDNIFLCHQEGGKQLIKILDFGLAKVKFPDTANLNSLTAPGTVIGTLGYMAPEQLSGAETDERTDIFSLGVMVVEALTGERPFKGKTYPELVTSILSETYRLTGEEPEIRALDSILQKCLARQAKDRFTSVDEMQRSLTAAIGQCLPLPTAKVAELMKAHRPSIDHDQETVSFSKLKRLLESNQQLDSEKLKND